jgi:prephenate dehydrogenase
MNLGTVAILGPGLIGGSLALALAERGLADKLVIYARKDATFPEIKKRLPQALLTTDVNEAVRGADVVVLCVPIETMAGLVKQFAGALKPTALVTDVGSVKESVDRDLAPLLAGKALWIGSHPMAGSEKAGFDVARADLFLGAAVIVTPSERTQPETKTRAEEFWRAVGGRLFGIAPREHDVAIAQVSHIPHIVAAELIANIPDEALRFAGSGLRDTTRVASGSPELWTEIIWANREAIRAALLPLALELKNFQETLAGKDKSSLRDALQYAHDQRSKLLQEKP